MVLSAPLHIHWELTNACNLHCLHCYQQDDLERGQLNRDDLLLIAKRITDAGVFQVTLTGGEPFLVKCLPEIVQHFISFGITPYITSNGTTINQETVDWLSALHIPVQISLDSHIPEKHDLIRKRKGAFNGAIRAVDLLSRVGVKISLAFCANKLNYRDMEGVILLALEHRIERVLIGEIIPMFGSNHGITDLLFGRDEYAEFIRTASSLKAKYKPRIRVQISTEWGFLFSSEVEHAPCTAMDRDMAILYSGDAYPCPFLRARAYNMGSLLHSDLKAIWHSNTANRFRRQKFLGCDSNDCVFYTVCKSGCKAALANCGEPIDRKDPRCPLLLVDEPILSQDWFSGGRTIST